MTDDYPKCLSDDDVETTVERLLGALDGVPLSQMKFILQQTEYEALRRTTVVSQPVTDDGGDQT